MTFLCTQMYYGGNQLQCVQRCIHCLTHNQLVQVLMHLLWSVATQTNEMARWVNGSHAHVKTNIWMPRTYVNPAACVYNHSASTVVWRWENPQLTGKLWQTRSPVSKQGRMQVLMHKIGAWAPYMHWGIHVSNIHIHRHVHPLTNMRMQYLTGIFYVSENRSHLNPFLYNQ